MITTQQLVEAFELTLQAIGSFVLGFIGTAVVIEWWL
jgi:hypothetical protein